MPDMRFDADLHQYSIDGQILPSVTQVLEGVGVVDYSYLPPATRAMALGRGSAVHSATQFDDEGDLDEAGLDDELRPYLAAWRKFRADSGFTPDLIEYRDYHRQFRYAGTLDRRGSFPDGSKAIIDIKTNQSEGWVALQLAAYAAFFKEPRAYRRICVEVRKDATYRAIEFSSAEYQSDFGRFLACVTVYRLQEAYGCRAAKQERKIA